MPEDTGERRPDPALTEMLREAERVLDEQIETVDRLDGKVERMMALGTSTLGGTLALGLFVVRHHPRAIDVWVLGSVFGGLALVLVALGFLVVAYVGARDHTDLVLGPDLDWVRRKAEDPSWGLDRHLVTLVAAYADFETSNFETIEQKARYRFLGVLVLAGAVATLSGGIGLVLWRLMTP